MNLLKLNKIVSKSVFALAGLVFALSSAHALHEDALIALGKSEFMNNCAACHGASGKGDGPVAEVLSQKPSDLTVITKKFSGKFPKEHIYRVIDGTKMINPHGDTQMPVWGLRYTAMAHDRAGEVPHDIDAQALVFGRITALVEYLKSIQAD